MATPRYSITSCSCTGVQCNHILTCQQVLTVRNTFLACQKHPTGSVFYCLSDWNFSLFHPTWTCRFVWPRDLCYVRYWRRNDDGSYGKFLNFSCSCPVTFAVCSIFWATMYVWFYTYSCAVSIYRTSKLWPPTRICKGFYRKYVYF
jgi:hypothetical protein